MGSASKILNSDIMAENSNQILKINKKSTISQYFSTTNCVCECGNQTQTGICTACLQLENQQRTVAVLTDKSFQLERKENICKKICQSCCNHSVEINCQSLDCPVLFVLNQWSRESRQTKFYRELLHEHF